MKRTLLKLMWRTGAFDLLRLTHRDRLPVVTFHRFSHDPADDSAIPAAALAEQLRYLATHYRVLPLSQLAAALRDGRQLPARAVALTIDDGYSEVRDIAWPLLRRLRIPATVFVVTGFADQRLWLWPDRIRAAALRTQKNSVDFSLQGHTLRLSFTTGTERLKAAAAINERLKALSEEARQEADRNFLAALDVQLPATPEPAYSSLTWDQIRELDSSGLEIGSHTCSHPILTSLTDDRLRQELEESRARLEAELGRRVETFCYPNGDQDERVRRAVRSAGYQCAVTCDSGLNHRHSDPLALARIHGADDLPHFVQNICGFEDFKNHLRQKLRSVSPELPFLSEQPDTQSQALVPEVQPPGLRR